MARRVNTQFLVTGFVVVCAVCAVGFLAIRYVMKDDWRQVERMGSLKFDDNDYVGAAREYGRAAGLSRADKETQLGLMMKQAEALYRASSQDRDNYIYAKRVWFAALDIDPDYKPALKRLLEVSQEDVSTGNVARGLEEVRTYAGRLKRLEPTDVRNAAVIPISIVQGWLAGVLTEAYKVDEAIKELEDLRTKDPENPELPLTIALAVAQQSRELERNPARQKDAQKLRDDCAKMLDSVFESHKQNPAMQLRLARAYATLGSSERSPDRRKVMQEHVRQAVDWARAAAKPGDANYLDIQIAAARFAAGDGKYPQAEEILTKLRGEYSGEPIVLIESARILGATRDPKKRQEAITMLANAPAISFKGARGYIARQIEGEMSAQLLSLRIDALGGETDPPRREELRLAAEEDYARLVKKLGENTRVLKLRGKLESALGKNVEAVQTFERAMSEQSGEHRDPELLLDLAQANLRTNQTGRARQLLTELLKVRPEEIGPRLYLAQLLLGEPVPAGEIDAHLRMLEQLLPNDARVTRLRLRLALRQRNPDDAKKYYDLLPETTREEQLVKAQEALARGDQDAAIALLEKIHAQEPAHTTIRQLIALYEQRNEIEKATRALDDAIKADPKDTSLQVIRRQMSGESPEELLDFRRSVAIAMEDEFAREMQLASIANELGNSAEAIEHLLKAEAKQPDDLRVKAELFQQYLATKQFPEATARMNKLVEAEYDQAGGLLYKFYLADAQDRQDDAMAISKQLLRERPEFAVSYQLFGRTLQKRSQFTEAIPQYMQALNRQRENAEALRGLIECYYALNNNDQAWSYIQQARRLQPRVGLFREMELNHALRFGSEPEKVVAVREAVLNRTRENSRAWVNYIESCQLAAQRIRPRNEKGAADLMKKAAESARQAKDKWPDDASFYVRLAGILADSGNPSDGEAVFLELLGRDAWKGRPEAHLAFADFYAKVAPERAEQPLRKATALAGNPPELLKRLAIYLAQQRRVDEALGVLDLKPDDESIKVLRASILANAGRFAEAEALLNGIIQKNPKSPDLKVMMAELWLNAGRFNEALGLCNEALEIDRKHARALACRAAVRVKQSRPDPVAAITDLRLLRDILPNDPNVRVLLADAYRMRRDWDSACRELEYLMGNGWDQKNVRLKLLDTYIEAHRWLEAQRLLDGTRAMPVFKDDPDWLQRQAMLSVRRLPTAQSNERQKLGETALGTIREAMKLAPRNSAFIRDYLEILLQLGDNDTVVKESKAFQDQRFADWWIPYLRGQGLARLKDKPSALVAYDEAFALANKSAETRLGAESVIRSIAADIGIKEAIDRVRSQFAQDTRWQVAALDLYRLANDTDGAAKLLAELLADLASRSPAERLPILLRAGGIYMNAKPPRANDAVAVYQQVLQLAPDNLEALNNLAMIKTDLINPPQAADAIKYSQQAYDIVVKAGSDDVIIKDTHAWVLVKIGRTDEAITLLRGLLDRQPFPEGFYHLGAAYLQRSQPKKALEQIDAANQFIARHNMTIEQELTDKMDKLARMAKAMIEMQGTSRAP